MTHCARILLAALAASALGGCNNYLTLPAPPMYVWPEVNQTWVQFMALTPEQRDCRQTAHPSCRTLPGRRGPSAKVHPLSAPHAP
jgi:hypothetical protein